MARLSVQHYFCVYSAAFVTRHLFALVCLPGQVAGVALQRQPRARLQLSLWTLQKVLPSSHLSQLCHGNKPLQSNTRLVCLHVAGAVKHRRLSCQIALHCPPSVQMCLLCVLNRTTAWYAGSRTAVKRFTAQKRASFRLGSSSSAGWCPSGWNPDPTPRHTSQGQKERTSQRTYRWLARGNMWFFI